MISTRRRWIGCRPKHNPKQPLCLKTHAALSRYYTDMGWVTLQVGIVRESLKRHGYERETLFLYTAEQGEDLSEEVPLPEDARKGQIPCAV